MIYDIQSVDCKFVETYFIAFPLTYKLWRMRVEKDYPTACIWNEKERNIMYKSFLKYWGCAGDYYHGQDWTYLY